MLKDYRCEWSYHSTRVYDRHSHFASPPWSTILEGPWKVWSWSVCKIVYPLSHQLLSLILSMIRNLSWHEAGAGNNIYDLASYFCSYMRGILDGDCFCCIGLPQRREPSGHNLLTCRLVLVLVAALGWGLLCWRLRWHWWSCSRSTLLLGHQTLRYSSV